MKLARFIRYPVALVFVAVAWPASGQDTTLTSPLTTVTDPLIQTASQATHVLSKVGPLAKRMAVLSGQSRLIVRAPQGTAPGAMVSLIQQAGGVVRRTIPLLNAQLVDLPNAAIADLSASALIERISLDRRVAGTMERTGTTVGAAAIRQAFGDDGTGVGVAIIDSGVTSWHDDLAAGDGGQRVDRFIDFVNGSQAPYDDYGHGSHVAGIIAGNGFDSSGARTGIAPGARLIVLKVLDASGSGYISDVIAALDYVVANKDALNIRVVNLSVGAGVHESYHTDPLTLAAKRAVDAGVVVVAAAGNGGRNPDGRQAYGGVTAPGNAPWVLTVGSSSHMGSVDRADDVMAGFSSRGPSAVDYGAKPDIVAPGVGLESLSDPFSALYATKSAYLLSGTAATAYLPYLSLSGTSMAAPVVSGTVALMLQANPALMPNQVKAVLQFTALIHPDYDALTQGAGFLNTKGAVELARLAANPSGTWPEFQDWGRRLVWGNQVVQGGWLTPDGTAWAADVTWGMTSTPAGGTVTWGWICSGGVCDESGGTWVPWQAAAGGGSHNAVWGSMCSGADCQGPWTIAAADDDGSVVWGTSDADESVVWGTSDGDESVVWGTSCSDPACEPVIWSSQ